MPQPGVIAIILHPAAPSDAGPLARVVGDARAELAERHRRGFLAAGAAEARVVTGPPAASFGSRLRAIARSLPEGQGLVVLGSGAVPLATRRDLGRFVAAAAGRGPGRRGLANSRFSADIVAVPEARSVLAHVPDLPSDNVLPRWLADAGLAVDDLADRWRLAVDIDSPLDLLLLGGRHVRHLEPAARSRVAEAIARIRAVAGDPGAELLVAGRTGPATLAWLTGATAARTRALVEERGLRASVPGQRPPASVLGLLLEHVGPEALGAVLARLADAAILDSRVLLAHRLGPSAEAWPADEDRFAADLLLHERIRDPWLRALTRAAVEAPIPILLGAHTLVGPGLRLLLRARS